MDMLILGSKCDVPLQIKKSFIRIALDLKTLRSFEVRFGVFFIKIDCHS